MKALLILVLAAATSVLSAQENPRARLFVQLGCPDCHSLVALKLKAKADVGPDLSAAYVDVPFRYGIPFERFFDQPPAVMQVVLGTRAPLRRRERDSLIALFRGLYLDQLARLDSAQRRVRPASTDDGALSKPR